VILNYVKRGEARGTWLESHFRWQIRTFWFGLLWVVLCGLVVVLTLGLGIIVVWLRSAWSRSGSSTGIARGLDPARRAPADVRRAADVLTGSSRPTARPYPYPSLSPGSS